jgi:hypothetical protein
VDITHDTSGSNRPVVLDNDELMYRRTSAALANSNEGSYYSADAGSANPLRVYINPVGDPNSAGHTYEVTTRTPQFFSAKLQRSRESLPAAPCLTMVPLKLA